MQRNHQVAVSARQLKLLVGRRDLHPLFQRFFQLIGMAFQHQAYIANRFGINVWRGEAFDARTKAAMNVVLQAWAWMVARQVHLATGYEKRAVDQISDAIGQISRKIRTVIDGAVFANAPRDDNLGIAIAEREFYIWVGLIVSQQHIEARFALLDQVVFQRQRFVL